MKAIPTQVHGVLDYFTAGILLLLPKMLGWNRTVTRRVQGAAVGTLLYSLVTKYEWGVGPLKVLPMPAHLALDGASGALFCAAPMLLLEEATPIKNTLVAIGLFELLVTLNSQTQTGQGEH